MCLLSTTALLLQITAILSLRQIPVRPASLNDLLSDYLAIESKNFPAPVLDNMATLLKLGFLKWQIKEEDGYTKDHFSC
jgi:hypothetical protein